MDNDLMIDVGQANQFKLACRSSGWTIADVKRLFDVRMLDKILPVVRGYSVVTPFNFVLACSELFDPVSFFGPAWTELETDERAYALKQVDFSKCKFLNCFKEGQGNIKGEEKLSRLKEDHPQLIRLGGNQFLALWHDLLKNGEDSVLEHLRLTQGITALDFPGLVLQRPGVGRAVLCLTWGGVFWLEHLRWLGDEWDARNLSALSPAS